MYKEFLEFFKKDVEYDIYGNDYRTFVIAFGGMQFGKGMFTVLDKSDAFLWERRMAVAFPERKGTFRLFGHDWMGRCFGVPASSEDKIIIFDPGVFEVYEVDLVFRDFINKAIPLTSNDCLASDAFIKWFEYADIDLPADHCVGYKQPLFLGGEDALDNFEIIKMDRYWYMISKAGKKLNGEDEGQNEGETQVEGEMPAEGEAPVEEKEAGDFTEDEYFAQQADDAEDFFFHQKKRAPYIRKNIDSYLEKFRKMNANKTSVSWNWCAFLFQGAWMLYRKLYKCFILVYLISIVVGTAIGTIIGVTGADPAMNLLIIIAASILLGLFVAVIVGMFSNAWYRKKIDKLVARGEAAETEEEKEKIYKKGGVNIPLLIIYLVISLIGLIPMISTSSF